MRVDGPDLVPREDDVQLRPGGRHRLRVRLGRNRLHVDRGYFWGGALVTGGLAISAIVQGVRAILYSQDYESPADQDAKRQAELRDQIETTAGIADALWVGSAASSAVATVLYLLSRGDPPEPQVTFE